MLRKIDYYIPKKIYENPDENYYDTETNIFIAVKKSNYYGKKRDIMIAYYEQEERVYIITIHPLKQDQKNRRVESGRWKKL